jgi:hypothetical protein
MSDPRGEPRPVEEPPPAGVPPAEPEEEDDPVAAIRRECRVQTGGGPCIKAYAKDMLTVTATYDCVDWCPVLGKRLVYA